MNKNGFKAEIVKNENWREEQQYYVRVEIGEHVAMIFSPRELETIALLIKHWVKEQKN